jgi:hypothetical protein
MYLKDIYLKIKADTTVILLGAKISQTTIKGASGVRKYPELKAFKAKVKLPGSEMALEESFVVNYQLCQLILPCLAWNHLFE